MLKLTNNAFNFLWHNYRAILLRDIAKALACVVLSGCVFSMLTSHSAYATDNSGGILDFYSFGYTVYEGNGSPSGYLVKVNSNHEAGHPFEGVFGADGNPLLSHREIEVIINLQNDSLTNIVGLWDARGDSGEHKDITINSGKISGFIYGASASAENPGKLEQSTIKINNIEFTGSSILGALADNSSANSNSIIINDGKFLPHDGGWIAGAQVGTQADKNTVTINGGYIEGNISGALATSDGATISSNKVILTGGTIIGSIYGGSYYNLDSTTTIEGIITFEDNSIVLDRANSTQELNLSQAALYGFSFPCREREVTSKGNILEVHHSGYEVNSIRNFNVYKFVIEDADLAFITGDNASPLLKITGGAATNLNRPQIVVDDRSSLNGQSVILLENKNGITNFDSKISGSKTIGVAQTVDYTIDLFDDQLIYYVGTLPENTGSFTAAGLNQVIYGPAKYNSYEFTITDDIAQQAIAAAAQNKDRPVFMIIKSGLDDQKTDLANTSFLIKHEAQEQTQTYEVTLLKDKKGFVNFDQAQITIQKGIALLATPSVKQSNDGTQIIYQVYLEPDEPNPADYTPDPDPPSEPDPAPEPTQNPETRTSESGFPDIDISHQRTAVRLNPQVKALAEANLGSAAAVVQSSSFTAQQGMGAALQAISRTKQQNAMQAANVYASQVNVGETGNVVNTGHATPAISPNYTGTTGTSNTSSSTMPSINTVEASNQASTNNNTNTTSPISASMSSDSVIAGFGVIGGSKTRMNTGSHIDNDSISLMAGLAVSSFFEDIQWTCGAFLEHGEGSYDTYNSFPDAASVHGSGDTDYTGLGILSRFDFSEFALNTASANVFLEGSIRAGRIHNEYSSGDLTDANNTAAAFKNSSSYYSFHVGTGIDLNVNDSWLLTLGAQYFYTHQSGSSVELSTGEHMEFDSVVSQRARLHSRLNWQATSNIQPYLGIAFEHEFDGTAESTIDGMKIESPSLGGNTWIGEIGLSVLPSSKLPLHINLGVQGYTGFMEGITGSLQMLWRF